MTYILEQSENTNKTAAVITVYLLAVRVKGCKSLFVHAAAKGDYGWVCRVQKRLSKC